MNAHRIKIFNRADNDGIVVFVAHHLKLILFPAKHRLFYQYLGGRAVEKATGCNLFKLRIIIRYAPARASHGKTRPDDKRIRTDLFAYFARLFNSMGRSAPRNVKPDLDHGIFKKIPVFSLFDWLCLCADHLNIVTLKDLFSVQLKGKI